MPIGGLSAMILQRSFSKTLCRPCSQSNLLLSPTRLLFWFSTTNLFILLHVPPNLTY
ncbi:unnamed protein product [Linum tenue]|uniref:Uncharacterized protein n=1 Tax=Linum tenue TaxID=586396 RepID=A0AAV0I8D9_9ROSI|nr:unnamed protein product [Linum tenue]